VQNLCVHITLPQGLALTSGVFLDQDFTFDVVSQMAPYYASVDQVRLYGGMYIRKLSDITIGCAVYQASQEADILTLECAPTLSPSSKTWKRFSGSRNQWVTAKAARNLVLGLMGLIGMPGSHVLANFSVQRQRGLDEEGVAAKMRGITADIALYEPVLRSGGRTPPGGYPASAFAAKGVFDWTERSPGRTWVNTGLGANVQSADFGSPTGGRGKPAKFFASTFYSPPIVSFRAGVFQSAYPLLPSSSYPGSA
jgi:hypothetical protein